jgi:simple sugar transport system permease protein
VRFQVTSGLSAGYGYAGIVIATLAELNPLGAIPAALFFAIVFNGAGTMARATGVPVYLADVIQGVALVSMVAGRLFAVYRLRLLPSPLAGEGQGGGKHEGRNSVLPPSPSLPRKGGEGASVVEGT